MKNNSNNRDSPANGCEEIQCNFLQEEKKQLHSIVDFKEIEQLILNAQSSKRLAILKEEDIDMCCDKIEKARVWFEKAGQYVNAERAMGSMVKMKEIMNKKKFLVLSENHRSEKEELEINFQNELKLFHKFWDDKISNYETEAKELELILIEKHKDELIQYHQNLNETLPKKPKESSEMLNLKAMIQKMVANQEYKDAHLLTQQFKKLEEQESQKHISEREQKLKNLVQAFYQKQLTELGVLRQKIELGYGELEKARNKELEKLSIKFESEKRALETYQLQEFNKFEKSFKSTTGSTINLNKSQYSSFIKSSPSKKIQLIAHD